MQIDACIRELSKDVNKAFLHLKNELQGYLKKELYSCHVNIWLQSLIQTIHTGLFPALNYTPDSSCVFTDYSGAWEPWHKNRPLKVAGRRWYVCWLPDSGKEIHQILHSVIISLIISLITLLSSVSCAGINEVYFSPMCWVLCCSGPRRGALWGRSKSPEFTRIEPILRVGSSCFLGVFSPVQVNAFREDLLRWVHDQLVEQHNAYSTSPELTWWVCRVS